MAAMTNDQLSEIDALLARCTPLPAALATLLRDRLRDCAAEAVRLRKGRDDARRLIGLDMQCPSR